MMHCHGNEWQCFQEQADTSCESQFLQLWALGRSGHDILKTGTEGANVDVVEASRLPQ